MNTKAELEAWNDSKVEGPMTMTRMTRMRPPTGVFVGSTTHADRENMRHV